MARAIFVTCDMPGCQSSTRQEDRAGSLLGWLRREVKDGVKKHLLTGVQDFDSKIVLHYCPDCQQRLTEAPSPPLHPEVRAFLEQPEPLPEPPRAPCALGPDPRLSPIEPPPNVSPRRSHPEA